jgi:hypothetical protein
VTGHCTCGGFPGTLPSILDVQQGDIITVNHAGHSHDVKVIRVVPQSGHAVTIETEPAGVPRDAPC